jgi:hypothetical protein
MLHLHDYHPHDEFQIAREPNPALERVQGGEELIGERVKVYRNLHLATFSVMVDGKVVMHADYIRLRDCEFVIQKGGQERTRAKMRKRVHAYVSGTLVSFLDSEEAAPKARLPHTIVYNPFVNDTFVDKESGREVSTAAEVELLGTRAYAKGLNPAKVRKGNGDNPAGWIGPCPSAGDRLVSVMMSRTPRSYVLGARFETRSGSRIAVDGMWRRDGRLEFVSLHDDGIAPIAFPLTVRKVQALSHYPKVIAWHAWGAHDGRYPVVEVEDANGERLVLVAYDDAEGNGATGFVAHASQ